MNKKEWLSRLMILSINNTTYTYTPKKCTSTQLYLLFNRSFEQGNTYLSDHSVSLSLWLTQCHDVVLSYTISNVLWGPWKCHYQATTHSADEKNPMPNKACAHTHIHTTNSICLSIYTPHPVSDTIYWYKCRHTHAHTHMLHTHGSPRGVCVR